MSCLQGWKEEELLRNVKDRAGLPRSPTTSLWIGPVAFGPKAASLCPSQNLWGFTNQKLPVFLSFEPKLWLGESKDISYYSFPENLLFSYTVDEHNHQDLLLSATHEKFFPLLSKTASAVFQSV